MFCIANTPVGVYKGKNHLGYAFLNVLLDVYSRYKQNKKEKIICPKHSLNLLGLRAEKLKSINNIRDLNDYALDWSKNNITMEKLNLSFDGNMFDTDDKAINNAQDIFSKLHDKNYIFRDNDTFFLDTNKINKDHDIESIVNKIEFYPKKIKKEFLNQIFNTPKPIRVTKERKYSAENPYGGERISPIFVVSNMWDAFYDADVDLIASSKTELSRYILLRFYSRIPISSSLPMKKILIYNWVKADKNEWDLNKILNDPIDSDSLRYVFSKKLSLNKNLVEMDSELLSGGKKLIYRIGNIKNYFSDKKNKNPVIKTDDQYNKSMENFQYNKALSLLEKEFNDISKKIRLGEGNHQIYDRYINSVVKISPFCPYISKKVLMELIKK